MPVPASSTGRVLSRRDWPVEAASAAPDAVVGFVSWTRYTGARFPFRRLMLDAGKTALPTTLHAACGDRFQSRVQVSHAYPLVLAVAPQLAPSAKVSEAIERLTHIRAIIRHSVLVYHVFKIKIARQSATRQDFAPPFSNRTPQVLP
jgi:hypothetical protein